jgi:DNA-directed RNA polymerase subunit L
MQTPDSTEFSTTFVMRDEDHTLGNTLRMVLNNK